MLLDKFGAEDAVTLRCCLAQSGAAVSFRADGEIIIRLSAPDTEKEAAAQLAQLGEVSLLACFLIDAEGALVKFHGGAREGAGRKKGNVE